MLTARRSHLATLGMPGILAALLLGPVPGCDTAAPARAPVAAPAGHAGPAPAAVYTETIPGSLVTFDLVPIPGTADLDPFRISATEVTWDAYDLWAFALRQKSAKAGQAKGASSGGAVDAESRPSRPYTPPDRGWGHQGHPAMGITYHAATMYCRWLSAQTGRRYRLPTEAEWEHACRAGAAKPSTPKRARPSAVAWYAQNSDAKTHPVAQKQPNAWGLHDMLGNVAEWCLGADGQPVVRGGSFRDAAADVHCGARRAQDDAWTATDPMIPKSRWWLSDAPFVGFRLVRQP